jgi:hypothetical protein
MYMERPLPGTEGNDIKKDGVLGGLIGVLWVRGVLEAPTASLRSLRRRRESNEGRQKRGDLLVPVQLVAGACNQHYLQLRSPSIHDRIDRSEAEIMEINVLPTAPASVSLGRVEGLSCT